MLVSFILFGIFMLAAGDSQTIQIASPSADEIVMPSRRGTCEVRCSKKCPGVESRACLSCYRRCWLMKGYMLDSGDMSLCG